MADEPERRIPTAAEVNRYLPEAFPAAANSGYRCDEIGDGYAIARWIYDEAELRPGHYISGPTMFTVADTALWFAVFSVVGIESMAVTSEMSIRFLRPAQYGDVVGRATIHSTSTRRIVGTVELWVDDRPDRLVAIAPGTYVRPV
ncbi:MAG TPA: PaaI family thioesterase [Acidimicrobiia bacterium]|nr:PaaI family thioesterase [Acidimicrobiia bacterium]